MAGRKQVPVRVLVSIGTNKPVSVAAAGVIALGGLTACNPDTDISRPPETSKSEEIDNHLMNGGSPQVRTATEAQTFEPTPSDIVELPEFLTAEGVLADTGGSYVDRDGYEEQIHVTIYNPVQLTDSDGPGLELCPDQVETSLSAQLAESGLKTQGGIAWAYSVSYENTNADFPFPLEKYRYSEGRANSSPNPSLLNTDFPPGLKIGITCVVSESESAAEFIGVATLLPEDTATPNNPEGKLPETWDSPLGLNLHEPLASYITSLGSAWKTSPGSDYGPFVGGYWTFDSPLDGFRDSFVGLKPTP